MKRLAIIPITLIIVSFFVFSAEKNSSGGLSYIFSEDVTESAAQAYSEEYSNAGYPSFILSFIRGDWGRTVAGESVRPLIASRFAVTLSVSLFSLFLSLIISVPVSLVSTKRRLAVNAAAVVIGSIPSFVIALILMILFSVRLRIFPVAGYSGISSGITAHISTIFLPSLTLALLHSSVYIRVFGKELSANTKKEYSLAAISLGEKERNIPWVSALKPSLPVLISLTGENLASAIAGAAVIETVFSVPGLGSLMVSAALSRDLCLSGSLVIVISFFVCIVSVLFEALSTFADKRGRNA